MSKKRIPVTLLVGFLGSGKTTLVNRILKEEHGKKIALIENEFGEVGIDNQLVGDIDEMLIEMNNGCICCNVKGDMIMILSNMLESKKDFDHVVIEATGMANPGPIIESFFGQSPLRDDFTLDSVVTVVDTANFDRNMKLTDEEAQKSFMNQLVFGEHILLNKIDLVGPEQVDKVRKQIQVFNKTAKFYETENTQVSLDNIFDCGSFNLTRIENELFKESSHDHSHDHHHHHHGDVKTVNIEAEGALNPIVFEQYLNYVFRQNSDNIYRSKGILFFYGKEKRVIFQGVYNSFEFDFGKEWESDTRMNQIVFIGKDLNKEALEQGFRKCLLDEQD